MAHTTANTPPMTEAGMAMMRADSLPTNESAMSHTEAITNTRRLATPVMEMMPALVE